MIVGSVDTPGYATGVAVTSTHAFVADYLGGLQIVDIGDPQNLALVANMNTPGWPQDVVISGTHAHLTTAVGLEVVAVSDPLLPRFVGGVSNAYHWDLYPAALSGTFLFAGSRETLLAYPVQCESSAAVNGDAAVQPTVRLQVMSDRDAPGVTMRFRTHADGPTRIAIYDACGRLVRELFAGVLPTGVHDVPWEGRTASGCPAAEGVYFVRAATVEGMRTARFVAAW